MLLVFGMTHCKISLRVNKQLNLMDSLVEEIMTITAQNLNDFKVKRLAFRFSDSHFKRLKIVRMADGSQWLPTLSHFPDNHFSLDFTTPKRENESFGLKVIAHYFQPFEFVPH